MRMHHLALICARQPHSHHTRSQDRRRAGPRPSRHTFCRPAPSRPCPSCRLPRNSRQPGQDWPKQQRVSRERWERVLLAIGRGRTRTRLAGPPGRARSQEISQAGLPLSPLLRQGEFVRSNVPAPPTYPYFPPMWPHPPQSRYVVYLLCNHVCVQCG